MNQLSMGGYCRRCCTYWLNEKRCPRCGLRTPMGINALRFQLGRRK